MSAFGTTEGPQIVQLIANLLVDGSAQPVLSLVATVDKSIVGHILFSKVRVKQSGRDVSAALLAPLAVHPDFQSQRIGGQLVTEGLRQLSESGVDLVFVLGHPGYYPRFGFSEAGIKGFEAPYPIPQKNAGAWMVQELHWGVIGRSSGRVVCADALDDPKFWRE
jgi:predicted N-acetyltransferase YhbS